MAEEEMQSLEELASDLQEYKTQRDAVAEMLESEPDNEEYAAMLKSLDEVIAITTDVLEQQDEPEAQTTAEAASGPSQPAQPAGGLHEAVRRNDISGIAQALVDGKVDAKDKLKRTAVHIAAWAGHIEALDYLIASGANVKMEAGDGITPLHMACQKGNFKAARRLVVAGANPRCVSSKGASPLHFAAQGGYSEVVVWLLKKGADPCAKNKKGQTAADLAPADDIREAVTTAIAEKEEREQERQVAGGSEGSSKRGNVRQRGTAGIGEFSAGAEEQQGEGEGSNATGGASAADRGQAGSVGTEGDAIEVTETKRPKKRMKKASFKPAIPSHLMSENDDADLGED